MEARGPSRSSFYIHTFFKLRGKNNERFTETH
nr:MAG TPA: hypothetical protein [Caudoviricetes sp.]